jgi:gliding motility-associated-like protein
LKIYNYIFKSTFCRGFALIFFAVFFYSFNAAGQSYFTTKGTDFWFGFLENYYGDTTSTGQWYPNTKGTTKMAVYVTTDNRPASGTISVPKASPPWSKNFLVPPNSTIEIDIPVAIAACNQTETIENKGVHLTADIPVSVFELNYVPFSSDAEIIYPTLSLGTQYRAMTYGVIGTNMQLGPIESSEILIVAAYDGTVIKITPKCKTVGPNGTMGHNAGIPFNITLNQGETYQLQGAYNAKPTNDLAGSLIELDTTASDNCKKFAVFSGNECSFVPYDSASCNHLCEEMMPIKTWGTDYITVPLKTRKNDRFRITASRNNTIVTWDLSPAIGLNAGQFYEYLAGTPTYIHSNHPVSVAQFSESFSTDGNVGTDPFMIMLQPLDQSIGKIVFNAFPDSVIHHYYLNVVTRTKYIDLMTLDNTHVPPAVFSLVPHNNAYSYARLDIAKGNHSLSSDSGYTANIYGYGAYSSYGYIAGATFIDQETGYNVITPADTFKYYNFNDTICRRTPLKFVAFNNPLILSYSWKFGDGSPVVPGSTVTHTYNNAGKYKLTFYYQQKGLCGLDSIVWYIYSKCCNPSPGIVSTKAVCIGNNAVISDTTAFNNNATYTWDFSGGTVVSGTPGSEGPYEVKWLAKGKDTVWVYVSEPTCPKDSANFVVTVNPIPTSTFKLNSPLCMKDTTSIIYTGDASSSASFNWNFKGGNVLSGTGMGPYVVSWNNPGKYVVTLDVTENNCPSLQSGVQVVISPLPNPAFTPMPQTTTTDNPLITFVDQSSNTAVWSWNFGEPSSGADNFSSLTSPTHSYSHGGDFIIWLIAKSSDGCIDSTSSVVEITDFSTFYVPNAFTPDFEENNVFQPYGTEIDYYQLYIFNRWGDRIFQSEIKNQPWDGRFNGKVAEPAVYVWYIKYYDKKGNLHKARGLVTLLR